MWMGLAGEGAEEVLDFRVDGVVAVVVEGEGDVVFEGLAVAFGEAVDGGFDGAFGDAEVGGEVFVAGAAGVLAEDVFEGVEGEVFGVGGGEALAAGEGVDGEPVGAADLFEGAVADGAVVALGFEDDAPAGVREVVVGWSWSAVVSWGRPVLGCRAWGPGVGI